MVKPISLRLRNAEIRARAEATLIRAGRADDVKRAHTARVMREARATVERAKEQKRLKAVAALTAHKAIAAVREAYWQQDIKVSHRSSLYPASPARQVNWSQCSRRWNVIRCSSQALSLR